MALAPKLAVLRALAQEEHVTKVADVVGLPQPTVSRWIAGIGEELGAPIVEKAGRGVRLTRAGRLVAAAAERAMAVLEAGWREAEEEVDPERGMVALGFLHMLGRSVVPELVRGFREAHPGVRFRLVQDSRQVVLEKLVLGEIDLALVAPLPESGSGLAVEVLLEQELVLVVPAGHALAGREGVGLGELAEEEFVLLEHGYGLRQITDGLFAGAGFVPKVAFEGQEIETVRGLVAAGLGVALLTRAEVVGVEVVEVGIEPRASRTFGLVWREGVGLPGVVREFREHALRGR
ncbi:LysR family transcriptional regulator [Umezawaea tangerina]|uniref:DNA-binding transcriptional LysR family regulator n=1 Tax=Umezawaea tangerina TaxID=84725 RepID=A0A2T0TMD0_9PSEU|nr:LysR family transcriptional regulator [Umezawaea tangerina]PRY46805.1 DNA-binding transcriptional LysR family regulator [Umezawaea tangerina]